MSIREMLARTDAGFVSLHDVILRLAHADGSSYEDAAAVLHRLLMAGDSADAVHRRPRWHRHTRARGAEQDDARGVRIGMEALEADAVHGNPVSGLWTEDDLPF